MYVENNIIMANKGESVFDSQLFQLLMQLNKRELTAFRQFLASPYFNQREDVLSLFNGFYPFLVDEGAPTKRELWRWVYGDDDFNDQKLRLLMSYLSKLIEQFIAVEMTLADDFEVKMKVANQLRSRADSQLHERFLKGSKRILEKQPLRNAEYWLHNYRHQEAAYRQAFSRRPEQNDNFALLSESFDKAFLALKLRQNMWLFNHEQLYKWGYQPTALDRFIEQLDEATLTREPALSLYYFGMQVLQSPTDEKVFQQFTQTLFAYSALFPEEEARDLYLLAINFGVRQVNEGQRSYFPKVMELYRNGLEQGYLLRNGVLSRFTYHNIVTTALQIGELTWAEVFIEEWTNKLERRFRDRMYHFNRAKIAYADQRYDEALPLLQQANYHDPLLNLGARTLLLKIYFELEEWEVLQSHLDAFQNYLRRKEGITYHRTNYRNLIRFTRQLLKAQLGSKLQRTKLRDRILQEITLTEKEWLLKQLGDD